MIKEYQVKNLSDLLEVTKEVNRDVGRRIPWFRGQASAAWKVVPSVHRRLDSRAEINMNLQFRLAAPTRYADCPHPDDASGWLFLMQHYGLPTRLLDWTESPLVAAYFACAHEQVAGPSAVWVLFAEKLNLAEINAETTFQYDSKYGYEVLGPAFGFGDATTKVIAALPREVDLRMLVQQSRFTIHGGKTPLEENVRAREFLRKITIPTEAKDTIRAELWMVAVRRSMLFPDLENLGKELVEMYEPGPGTSRH